MRIEWKQYGTLCSVNALTSGNNLILSFNGGNAAFSSSMPAEQALLLADEIRRAAVEMMDDEHEAAQQRMRQITEGAEQ